MKKLVSIIFAAIMVLSLMAPAAFADNAEFLGRVSAKMPNISVEITGIELNDESEISAKLANEQLTIDGNHKYDSENDSTCTFILADLSGSMNKTFEIVKKNIISYIDSKGENDKVVVITFGTELNELLTGDETAEEVAEAINALECNEDSTLLYAALSRAYTLSTAHENDEFTRKIAIVFTDGADDQQGNTTLEEAKNLYASHILPLYAMCMYHGDKEGVDNLGIIARASGGDIVAKVDDADDFNEMLEKINDVTILDLKASNNYTDGSSKKLMVTIDGITASLDIVLEHSTADTTPPTIEETGYDADRNVFTLTFSENVLNADNPSSYKITDPKGAAVEIESIHGLGNTYELKLKDYFKNGTYVIECPGVTDDSQEANHVEGSTEITLENIVEKHDGMSPAVIAMLAVGLLLIIGVIVLVVVLATRKKPEQQQIPMYPPVPAPRQDGGIIEHRDEGANQFDVKHHIVTEPAGVRVRLKIRTGKTTEQNVEVTLSSSIIVGRSSICDIYIDDPKLSRQHFAIENNNGKLYISDLQSRNGTMLNGIRISSRMQVKSGDRILAGLSDIVFTVLGR